MVSEETRSDPRALWRFIIEKRVERLFMPYVALQQLANARHGSGESEVRDIISAGEALQLTPEIRRFVDGLGDCRLHNHYGPTETHVVTSYQLEAETGIWPAEALIGRPIANTQVYILNDALQPLPIGIAGELYIGGSGLARGYLNRPELTAERFIEIEILGRTERVYRTGDLCRWRADGNLEFLGRMDDQVKIRGYRIELGEIEAVLSAQPGIMESVVLAREDTLGEKRLVAYVVLDQENPTSTVALRRALAEKLPGYMLPTAYVSLDTLPLTTNGKLDRNALPVPELDRSAAGVVYTAPRTPIEESLASIWKEVLGLKQVGIHDDFFELGGHSLQATRVVSRIGLVFEVNLPLRRLFDAPTIHNLANSINLLRGDEVVQPCSKRQVAPITIHRGLGNTEVFLFHGGDGGSLPFLPLTRFMDPHASIFAFEHPALHDWEEDPESSVTELADRYTDALLMRTVSGPYIIAGWSFGGLVAHEVAHRLIDQGKEVGLLALLDSYLPIQGSKPASEGTLMRKFLRGWGVIDTVIDSHFDETVHFTEAASVRLIQQCIRDSVTKTRAVSDQLIERQFQVYRNAVLAARGYVPRRGYPGRITQFRALESIRAGALGWESVEASQLEIFDVPGDHYSMLLDPNVAGLGQMINERLDGNPLLTKI
jgi:thioesterase domain-containing protein/acyl carrier protein